MNQPNINQLLEDYTRRSGRNVVLVVGTGYQLDCLALSLNQQTAINHKEDAL